MNADKGTLYLAFSQYPAALMQSLHSAEVSVLEKEMDKGVYYINVPNHKDFKQVFKLANDHYRLLDLIFEVPISNPQPN